ncbi:MAG TPA: sulfite exporter TauE/SafE family protein [Actinomycetota bacterium]|nr:sulfite exporter TauE/SafE family protein [Actinomycetota bacterium]
MTPGRAALGAAVGLAAGLLSGLFGVGGGIVTTPAIHLLLGAPPYVAVGTPLPVIFPTALVGAYTYWRSGEISLRAARWAGPPGAVGAILGAWATALVDPHWLLLVTAVLIGWQAVRVARPRPSSVRPGGETPGAHYAMLGFATGAVSGLLGVGGGIIFVPIVTTVLGMPLKRALGTSLLLIAAIAIPGTLVHARLGHIDWGIFAVLVAGVVPGARLGARLALGRRERTLRLLVAGFLAAVAVLYGAAEASTLLRG